MEQPTPVEADSWVPTPPGMIETEEEDDDDMADLFSFGPGEETAAIAPISSSELPSRKTNNDSPDSFIEILEAETSNVVVISDASPAQHDQETQDILKWLDEDDDTTEEIVFHTSLVPPEPIPEPTVVALPPSFDTFQQAMASNESTTEQVRTLFTKEQAKSDESILDKTQRKELYCRMVCNKTQNDTMKSSLIDSFEKMKQEPSNLDLKTKSILDAIIATTPNVDGADLAHLVCYQRQQGSGDEADSLVPAVAAVVLSTGLHVNAAAVILSQLIPSFMPLLALPAKTERWDAALALHSEFYLLACYHLPMLVVHLDRHVPGWHWPKASQADGDTEAVSVARNLTKHGQIPPSWLVAQFATLPSVLSLWDRILTSKTNSSRFFLTLAVLERAAPRLLLLTGDELIQALQNVWSLNDMDIERKDAEKEWKFVWWKKAKLLEDATPDSALSRLQSAEDTAVQNALKARQERKEAAMQARLDAEAAAHREAQEKKAEEARQRLSRARLVAFYRKHAPSKESNVEKIMETYAGKLDVLDAKLRSKYGEGFNPSLKPRAAAAKPQLGLLSSMNQGFGRKKSDEGTTGDEPPRKPDKVSLMVTAEEVLPVVCWSKEEARAERRRNKTDRRPLRYYLVDSRSEEAAAEQGRFPTAVTLSPEAMMDPERLKENADMFESLRAAVHIVIMGEGFNAIPRLYDQRLSPKLTELMEQDESRTNLCALFFQKRGFCFVSILDGGFCAAHSWLVREGPSKHLSASSVLVDYNPEASLFGQLEKLRGASATEKAQRKMANLLETSMFTMTKRAQQLERIAMDLDEGRRSGIRIGFFNRSDSNAETDAGKPEDAAANDTSESKPEVITPSQEQPTHGFGKFLQQGGLGAAINKTQKRWGQSGGFGGFQQLRKAAVSRVMQTKDASTSAAEDNNSLPTGTGTEKPVIQKV